MLYENALVNGVTYRRINRPSKEVVALAQSCTIYRISRIRWDTVTDICSLNATRDSPLEVRVEGCRTGGHCSSRPWRQHCHAPSIIACGARGRPGHQLDVVGTAPSGAA